MTKGISQLSRLPRIKKRICNGNRGQSTISEQVFKIFGHCQNHQNQTLKWPYLPKKSRYENSFFIKRNTILLLYMYQVFILLLGHLPFFLLFFFTFMENFFLRQSLLSGLRAGMTPMWHSRGACVSCESRMIGMKAP